MESIIQFHPNGYGLRHEENDEVFVHVVEVACIPLVEVVGELRLRVILGGNARVEIHHAEGISVPDAPKDASNGLGVARDSDGVDLAGAGERIIGARTLPERDGLRIDELGILVMEGRGLEEHVSGRAELGQHDNMLKIFRSETLLAANVEQRAHAGETINIERHRIRRVADEIGIKDRLRRSQILAVLRIVSGKQIDCLGAAFTGDCTAIVLGVHGFNDHVVDGTHDEAIVLDGEGLLDLIEQHRNEGVQLGRAGEALAHLPFGD